MPKSKDNPDPRGHVSIILKGKTYRVRFDLNALADAQQLIGPNFLESLQGGNIGFHELRCLFFASIKGQRGIKKVEEAGALIDLDRLEDVAGAVASAFALAFPDGGEEEEEEGEALAA